MVRGEMKPIENEETRQICFTKRRQSLFNKASELSILCGAMVGSVVFSTFGTPFSFGHPSIDDVANRFLSPPPPPPSDAPAASSGGAGAGAGASGSSSNDGSCSWAVTDTIRRLNSEYAELRQALDSESKKRETLQEATGKEMGARMMQLLNANVSELGLAELLEFLECLEAVDGVVNNETANKTTTTTLEATTTSSGGSQTRQGLVPQPPMETVVAPAPAPAAADLQYQLLGEHSGAADPMAFAAPTTSWSSEFVVDGFEVDDPMHSGGGSGGGDLHDVYYALGDFPGDDQNHG
jgi:hypothetical protein